MLPSKLAMDITHDDGKKKKHGKPSENQEILEDPIWDFFWERTALAFRTGDG